MYGRGPSGYLVRRVSCNFMRCANVNQSSPLADLLTFTIAAQQQRSGDTEIETL